MNSDLVKILIVAAAFAVCGKCAIAVIEAI